MPAATLGRFRFYLSTDDLFFPHAFNAGLYGVVFCVFSTVFYIALALFSTHAKKCTDTEFTADFHLVRATGFILSGIFLLHFLCSCCCAWIACKGTMLQMSERRHAVPLALASMLLSVLAFPALGTFITLTYLLAASDHCARQLLNDLSVQGITNAVELLLTLCWVMVGVVVAGPLLSISLLNLYPSFREASRGCCTGLVTCCGCEEAFADTECGDCPIEEEVTNIMSRIFGPMPLVASDIFAGTIFLSAYQARHRQALMFDTSNPDGRQQSRFDKIADTASRMLTPPNLPLSPEEVKIMADTRPCSPQLGSPVRKETLYEAEYFLHFAQAAYATDLTEQYGELARTQVTNALARMRTTSVPRPPKASALAPAHGIQSWLTAWKRWVRGPFHRPPKDDQKQTSVNETSRKLRRWRGLLTKHLGLADEDILDLQFENKALGTVPYFIALDRIRNNIVVSIRGSYSLQDAFTDFITTAAPMSRLLNRGGLFREPPEMPDIDGSLRGADGSYQPPSAATSSAPLPASPHDPTRRPGKEAEEVPSTRQPESVSSGWAEVMGESLNAMDSGSKRWDEIAFPGGYAHRGILLSAVRLLDAIKASGVLAKAVTEFPDWKVVITGHSLGAGLAALLAMAIEPDLQGRLSCWAYCPPGGLMSVDKALSCAPYVTSVVHAKDMVTRLTWRSLERLRDELMAAVALSKINKNELWFRSICYRWNPGALSPDKLLHAVMPKDHEVRVAVDKYNKRVKIAHLELGLGANLRTLAPGRLIYLRPLKAGGGHHGGATRHEALRAAPRVYDAIWISYETLEAEGLLVSPNAAEDHILVAVHRALCQSLVRSRSCMGSTGGDLESGGGTASRP